MNPRQKEPVVSIRRALFAIAGMGLAAAMLLVGVPAALASASLVPSGAHGPGVAPRVGRARLYGCEYGIKTLGTRVWEFPGGSRRKGNRSYAHTVNGTPFNSIPYIITGKVYRQRWVYGELETATATFGWVSRSNLTQIRCEYDFYITNNNWVAKTAYGDPFASEPYTHTGKFRGQTWVWGIDPFATKRAGWVARSALKESSCNSSGCFYDISAQKNREWILPGGSDGP